MTKGEVPGAGNIDGSAAADDVERFLRAALLGRHCASAAPWPPDPRSVRLEMPRSKADEDKSTATPVDVLIHGFWHLQSGFRQVASDEGAASMRVLTKALTGATVSNIEVLWAEGFIALHFGPLTQLSLDCDHPAADHQCSFSVMYRRRVLTAEAPGRWGWQVF